MANTGLLSTCCLAVIFAACAVNARPANPDGQMYGTTNNNTMMSSPMPTKHKRSTKFNDADEFYADDTPVRSRRSPGVGSGQLAPTTMATGGPIGGSLGNVTTAMTPLLKPKAKRSPDDDDDYEDAGKPDEAAPADDAAPPSADGDDDYKDGDEE